MSVLQYYINSTKLYSAALLVAVILLLAPMFVSAQPTAPAGGSEPQSVGENLQQLGTGAGYDISKNKLTDYPLIVGLVISYFMALMGVIYLGLVVYAGSVWLMAHGNEDAVVKAKTIIRNATIGVILVVGSYAIVYFVLQALSSGGFNKNLEGF